MVPLLDGEAWPLFVNPLSTGAENMNPGKGRL
jgi:hypothetical protein